ncbi:MAG: VCBS repeat-containing protein [Dokdonella sp.]
MQSSKCDRLDPGIRHQVFAIARNALAGILVVATIQASAQIAFEAQTPMPTGPTPYAIAVGDFNADGKLDLAVAMLGNNRVYIYSGNGLGAFSFAISYVVGNEPVAIVAADLNHDGKLDLAVANHGGSAVSILLGNGNATFSAAVAYAVGPSPYRLAAGSFDPDGFVDLVTANNGNVCTPPFASCGSLSLLRNNGDGTFVAGAMASLSPGDVPTGIASGVLTTGGDTDLVFTGSGSNEYSVYLGDGGGGFAVHGPFATASADAIVIADFNKDGKNDLAISRVNDGDISLQYGNGDGSFQAAAIYSAGAVGAYPDSAVVTDLDGDSFPDLALANYNDNSVAVMRTRTVGNLGFDAALTVTGGLDHPSSIAEGDFNGDGRPDLVVTNAGSGTLSILINTSVSNDRIFGNGFEMVL